MKSAKTRAFFRQISALTLLIFCYMFAPHLCRKKQRVFWTFFLQFLAPQRSLKFFALRVFEHFFDKISALALLNIFTPTYIFWPTKPAINYVFWPIFLISILAPPNRHVQFFANYAAPREVQKSSTSVKNASHRGAPRYLKRQEHHFKSNLARYIIKCTLF